MKKEYITKKTFKNLNHLKTSCHTESILFASNDKIYKFLKKEYLYREQLIKELEKLKHDSIVTPLTYLYDKSGFLGYSMIYYKDYEELNSIFNKELSFKERKEICINLCNIFNYMEENDFAYEDIHENNILYKDNDIKIIDLDSGIFRTKDNTEKYDSYLRAANYFLSNLILSILYLNNSQENYYIIHNIKELYSKIPNHLINLYKYIINKDGTFIDILDFLDKIDENTIEDTKNILKRSIK